MEAETKKCAKCGQEKPLTEFYRNKKSSDGLQSYCKNCAKSFMSMYYKSHAVNTMRNHEGGVKRRPFPIPTLTARHAAKSWM